MKKRALLALAALVVTACEPSRISEPSADAGSASPSTTMHGEGTAESPYYWVFPGDWEPTYSFSETEPLYQGAAAPCPPRYNGTLWMYIDIANVGRRKFWFQGPMFWTRTIAPGFGVYDLAVPGVDAQGEWTASGPVVAECRRGLLPGLGMIRLTDHLGQLRRNGINAGSGCGDGSWGDDVYMTSYDPYAHSPEGNEVSANCSGGGSDGGGDGFDPGDYTCSWEHVTIEISRDGGQTWEPYWSGWAQVCDQNMT